jgi:hypothetical protein
MSAPGFRFPETAACLIRVVPGTSVAYPRMSAGTSPKEGLSMPRGSSPKRERQYEHIEKGQLERGTSPRRAKEIAARTVNKERARSGEAKTASKESLRDMSSSRRGGLHSHSGASGPTYRQLYAEAKRRGIEGRSKMSKAELEKAVG